MLSVITTLGVKSIGTASISQVLLNNWDAFKTNYSLCGAHECDLSFFRFLYTSISFY